MQPGKWHSKKHTYILFKSGSKYQLENKIAPKGPLVKPTSGAKSGRARRAHKAAIRAQADSASDILHPAWNSLGGRAQGRREGNRKKIGTVDLPSQIELHSSSLIYSESLSVLQYPFHSFQGEPDPEKIKQEAAPRPSPVARRRLLLVRQWHCTGITQGERGGGIRFALQPNDFSLTRTCTLPRSLSLHLHVAPETF